MKHAMAILCLLVITSFYSTAQEPKIKLTWGTQYQLPKGHEDLGFIGNMKDGFLQIGHAYGKSLSLQKFSTALKFLSEKSIDMKDMPKGYDIESFFDLKGKYYWLYSTWTKGEEKERLFVQEIDIQKGTLVGTAKELVSCNKVTGVLVKTGYYSMHKGEKFKVRFSSDSTKMYVHVIYPNESKDDSKNKKKFGFWVFDNSFKQLWSTPEIYMPYTEKKMDVKNTTVDNSGDFLFLGRVYNDDTEKDIVDGEPNFHFEIIKFSQGAKSASTVPLQFTDKFISQAALFQDQQSNIVCAGFYAGKDKNGKLKSTDGRVDGSFFFKLDLKAEKFENIHNGFYEIPSSVFKDYEKQKAQRKIDEKEAKGENVSASNMQLRQIIFNEDGSLLLVGEENYVSEHTYPCGNSQCISYTYYYQDVLAQYINADGTLSWTKKIPKNQMGTSTFGLGIRVVAYKGSNYIFFLDNEKNLNITPDQAPAQHSGGWGGVLMAVKLDASGELKKSKIFDTRSVDQSVDILSADRVGPNMLLTRSTVGANKSMRVGFQYVNDSEPSKPCLITIE